MHQLCDSLSQGSDRPVLIIGYGNPDRGDDAAGLRAACALRESGLAAEEFTGDGFALLERWSQADTVVVIDAVVTGAPRGTITVWNVEECTPVPETITSTHGIGLGEAIRMAKALGRLPRRLTVVGIEGRNFRSPRRPEAPET